MFTVTDSVRDADWNIVLPVNTLVDAEAFKHLEALGIDRIQLDGQWHRLGTDGWSAETAEQTATY